MAEPVSLEELKRHLRVEFDDDDDLILGLALAAREWAEGFLNTALVAKEGEEPPEIKQTWKQAILLMVANWYQNRETGKIPDAARHLLWLDRDMPV